MKKDITRLIILSIFLFLVSTVIIITFGRTYTIYFDSLANNDSLLIEEDKDSIKVLEEKKVDNKYIVKVKAQKPGKVYLSLEKDDIKEMRVLYVHKSLVITENSLVGKSNCSEIIPISLSIFLVYSIYLLIKRYKKHIKENLYQYRNIAYLGIIIFLSLFTVSIIFSISDYQGIYTTINDIISSANTVSFFIFPIAVITFILVTISNIRLIIKEGISLRNLLGLFLGIFICLSTLLPDFVYKSLMKSQKVNIYNLNSAGPYIYNFVEALVYLSIAYLECVLIGTIILAIKSVRRKLEYNKDYMIILGCQIKKDGTLTPLLKGRVDKALAFRNEQLKETGKDLIFIPSGGKGNDEIISEGEAMKNYLVEQGIKEKNIIVENKSKNTYENIKLSNNLIKKNKANICYSTTNYHVLRAGLIATEQGLKLEGIGSRTKAYFWINAFIREFIGTLYSEKKKHLIVIGLIIVFLIIMIYITYLANNI